MTSRKKIGTLDPRLKTLQEIQTDLMAASLVASMMEVPEALREQVLSALRQVDAALRGEHFTDGRTAGEDALRAWSTYRLATGLPR